MRILSLVWPTLRIGPAEGAETDLDWWEALLDRLDDLSPRVEALEVGANLRQVANRAFYKRAGVQSKAYAWVDAEVKDQGKVDEVVQRWTPRFYELLASTSADENVRLSQEGDLLLLLAGRNVFVTDDAPVGK